MWCFVMVAQGNEDIYHLSNWTIFCGILFPLSKQPKPRTERVNDYTYTQTPPRGKTVLQKHLEMIHFRKQVCLEVFK